MKDIDFDELDKAVNSLMGSASDAPEQRTKSSIVGTPVSTDPHNSMELSGKSDSELLVSPRRESGNASSLASAPPELKKRSAGRFMDVVHPSSDMRNPSTVHINTPSRSAGITPPDRSEVLPTKPQPLHTTETKQEETKSTPTGEKPTKDVVFPDPLDSMQKDEESTQISLDNTSEEAETFSLEAAMKDVPAEVTNTSSTEPSEPLESLFLPNIKVEKRPLGATNDTEDLGDDLQPKIDAIEDDSKAKTDTLVVPDPTLAELGDDVLAIESDASIATTITNGELTTEANPTPSARSFSMKTEVIDTAAISSIPRQYNVKPGTDDKHHEALYDAAAHTGVPLQHLGKKKPGWMVVLWIALLIVVGVGGALALYVFKVF